MIWVRPNRSFTLEIKNFRYTNIYQEGGDYTQKIFQFLRLLDQLKFEVQLW